MRADRRPFADDRGGAFIHMRSLQSWPLPVNAVVTGTPYEIAARELLIDRWAGLSQR